MAQLVKNLPAMWETWVQSLGWGDPLEKGKASHSSIAAWRIPGTCTVYGVAKSQTRLSKLSLSLSGTSLDHAKFSCCRSFITVKKDKESF